MRTINEIIIHCSDTPEGKAFFAADIDQWHKQRGFVCIGYHFVIDIDGNIEIGRPLWRAGAHCKGHNNNSIGICYIGGRKVNRDKEYHADTRTAAQLRSMWLLITTLLHCYPSIKKISGHSEYNKTKVCPCFDVHAEYDPLLTAIRNIDYLEAG